MITLARVLTAFVLSATLFAGCGPNQLQQQKEAKAAPKQEQEAKAAPKQEQEAKAAPKQEQEAKAAAKQEDQKQKNTVIARKIFVLSGSDRPSNTRSLFESEAMVSAIWDQASLLVAEYQGPGYQEFRKDVTELLLASKSKAYWLAIFREELNKEVGGQVTRAAQKHHGESQKKLEDLTKVLKSKYLGED